MSGPFALHPTPRCGAIVCRLPAVLGGDVLFSAESAAASRGLCAILAFRPFSVAVTGATINGLLDEATLTPHAMRGLLWLGLAELPQGVAASAGAEASADATIPDSDDPASVEADAAAAAVAAPPASLPAQLSFAPTPVALTARLHAANATIELDGATVRLPTVRADVVGGHARVTVAAGARAVAARAAALRLDSAAWAATPPPTTPARRALLPLALHAEAEHGGAEAAGWWTTTGFLLRAPLTAALDFTPALVGGVLGYIHPLLAGAVRLQEEDAVRVSVSPAGAHLPCRSLSLGVSPMRISVAPNALILGSLAMVDKMGRARRVAGGGSGAPALSRSASRKGAPPDRLEAWTSAIAAVLHADTYTVDSGRLDMVRRERGRLLILLAAGRARGRGHTPPPLPASLSSSSPRTLPRARRPPTWPCGARRAWRAGAARRAAARRRPRAASR